MAKDHFEKQDFKPGQVSWNFNLVFDDQPAVAKMAEEYATAIQHPGLYPPIPPQWLHATILAVGSPDDYSQAEMLEVATKLQTTLAQLVLPEFSFDSWWLWGGNVVLHVSPDDEFGKLYDHVIKALQSVVGPKRTTHSPHGNFIAHTALAYTKTHDREHEIIQQLSAYPVESAQFKATRMPLIKTYPANGHWEWEIVKDIAIGAKI